MLELALKRRSIRRYTSEDINDSLLDKILKIALLAPSSWGKHPVEFVVVRNKPLIQKLAQCKRIGAGPLVNASVAVVVAVDRKDCELWIEDGAVASTYLLLAAEHYGLGACWIQMRGREGQNASAEEEIKGLLGIPAHFGVLNVIALGVKDENKPARKEEDLALGNLHYEDYGTYENEI